MSDKDDFARAVTAGKRYQVVSSNPEKYLALAQDLGVTVTKKRNWEARGLGIRFYTLTFTPPRDKIEAVFRAYQQLTPPEKRAFIHRLKHPDEIAF